jgi:crotonobetainyl-CoA:carnitine CoA-transferase CaiB-like acyl-CoA transferase
VHDCAHLQSRQALLEIEVEGRTIRSPGPPVRMSDSASRPPARAPHLGEHTDEVLRRLLRYSDEQLQALRAKGVC